MTKLPAKIESKSIKEILLKHQEHFEEKEFNLLANYFSQSVVALGTNEAFALRDNEGEIRAFKQRVHLSAKDGTLIQPVHNGPFVVSAQGYEVWAESAGANVIFPKEVLVGNDWKQNPYSERDPENRRILAVTARAVAFRFSSKGIPQVSDWSTIFDTPSYRLIDLLAKAKKLPQAFRLLPAKKDPPEDGEKDTWAEYPFDESTRLWVNTSHPDALSWYSQIINREKKSLDFAQTFARRNALKHLSGIQKAPGPEWDIEVLSWRPTSGNIVKWDATHYNQLQDKVGSLIQGTGEDFAPGASIPQIEKDAGKEIVSEEEIAIEQDPEDQETEPPIEVGQGETPPEPVDETQDERPETKADDKFNDEQKVTMKNYHTTVVSFPAEVKRACEELSIGEGDKIGPTLADAIMKLVNQYIDEQAG